MKELFEKFYENEIKKPGVGCFWKGFALFLLGVVVGFLLAPIKQGLRIGCGNACNNGNDAKFEGNDLSASVDSEKD